MLKDIGEALGPWPILQVFFGLAVLGVGAYALIRGVLNSKSGDHIQLEDKRQEWEAYEHLRSLDENIEKVVDNQRVIIEQMRTAIEAIRQMTEQLKALAAAIWNRGV